ncbi:MAG TPA: thioesterase family protein [Rhizobiaceae bacterium]|nr:thioesterase family protein [Rhizobiaceae bacterium]
MPNLLSVLRSLSEHNGAYLTDAPQDWAQGRALFGGIVAALCANTARLSVADLPPLRSAQVTFAGPAHGRLAFRADILRRGRTATVVSVDCTGDDKFAARVVLTYGAARESRVRHDRTARPPVPAPQDCNPFFPEGQTPPGFFQNFEMRLAEGERPLSGAARPEFAVWVRHVEEQGVDPTIALLALADSLPPAAMVQFPAMAPISTMSWGIDFFQPITSRGWHLLRSTSEQAADGYSLQSMAVWDAQGRRIAAGRQAVALFV